MPSYSTRLPVTNTIGPECVCFLKELVGNANNAGYRIRGGGKVFRTGRNSSFDADSYLGKFAMHLSFSYL